jgi:hypothetical protein
MENLFYFGMFLLMISCFMALGFCMGLLLKVINSKLPEPKKCYEAVTYKEEI